MVVKLLRNAETTNYANMEGCIRSIFANRLCQVTIPKSFIRLLVDNFGSGFTCESIATKQTALLTSS